MREISYTESKKWKRYAMEYKPKVVMKALREVQTMNGGAGK